MLNWRDVRECGERARERGRRMRLCRLLDLIRRPVWQLERVLPLQPGSGASSASSWRVKEYRAECLK